MPTVLPLSKLVDLALGTPEVGAVNFNVLHTLLHAMITKLNLNDMKAEINDSDRDFLSSSKPQRVLTALSDIDSGKGEDSEDALSEFRDSSETDSTPVSSAKHKSKRAVPYHHLELRVEKLAEQLESLNALPSTADLLERAKAKGDGERPVAEMWQYMQLKKRVDANEDGVGKLMSLVEDLMKEMQVLRDANADLLNKVNSLDIDDLKKKLAELEKITNDLNDKFSTLPSPEEYAQFVTWPLLEDALKGVRKDMEGLSQSVTPTERVVVEIASQTDPKIPSRPPSSRPPSSRPPSSRPLSRLSTSSSGPTDNLLDVLERLGKLSEDHTALAKRVQELEDQLKNKVDKEALENLTQELTALREKLQDLQPVQTVVQTTPVQHPETPPCSPIPKSLSPPPKSPSPIQKTPSPEPREPTPEIIRTPSPVTKSPSPPPKSPTPPPKSPTPPPKSPTPPPASPDVPVREPSPPPATPPLVPSEPEPVELTDVGMVVDHLLTQDLSSDLLDQLNKLKEEMDALQALRDKHPELSSHNLQKYMSKSSSVKTHSSKPTSSDAEASDSGTISGSEGVSLERSKSDQELLSILSSRVSDSEAFEELIGRLGNLEDKFKALQNAILNPTGLEDSGFSSEPVSDMRSFLSDMEEKMDMLSADSSNTQTTENTSEPDMAKKRWKSVMIRRASLATTDEKPESGLNSQFDGIFGSDSADDESGQEAVNAVSVELAHTNEKLKRLGTALDQQMGQLKDKVFKLDNDLKRMAKGVEFALLRSRVSGLSDMSVTTVQQEKEDKIIKVQSAIPNDDDTEKAEKEDSRYFDNDALSRAQQAILQLQAELEKLQTTTNNIISENQHRSKQIESLLTYCDTLQEKKADKEYVAMEVDVKADKRQLENKVNHSLFDSTTGEINRLIKEILDKLDGNDSGWKDAFKQLAEDVDGKLDRLEINPLKEWLENRLKALNKKIMANAQQDWGEDDAAGLRKQLLQRFNCLSCDRPVDLMPTGPVPSLPSQNGLPGTRSPRPYTTFELEQIRQHAKSGMLGKNMVHFERALAEKELAKMRRADLKAFLVHFGQDIEAMSRRQQEADFNSQDVSDYYATMRQCGGSHTLTYPHKRVSRMTQMNNLFKEETEEQQPPPTTVYPVYKEEVDVQGVDGHIYRGRMERVQIEAKMPSKMAGGHQKQGLGTGQRLMQNFPQTESAPVRSSPTPPVNMRGRPMSALGTSSPRPGSGRPMSRPQSRPMSARQSGQESSRTTPFPDDSYNQTDGADQGQTTVVEAEAIRVDVPTPDITEEPTE